MISSLRTILPILALSFWVASCTSTRIPQATVQDGHFSMKDSQPMPAEFLQRTFAPTGKLPVQLKPYIDFWSQNKVTALEPKHFNQARGIIHGIAALEGIDDNQRKVIDMLALELEHHALMFDLSSALAKQPKNTEEMEHLLQSARLLQKLRKRFPELATHDLLQEEQRLDDCMLQQFAKLFEDAKPYKLPLVSWNIQSASSYKNAHESLSKAIPSDVACLTIPIDLFKDQPETFINFRSLPKGTAILINGEHQTIPADASSGTFRIPLPSYDKADGRASITLLIPLPLPTEPPLAPWLSQRIN